MKELNSEQSEAVKTWTAEGASLSEIQKRLAEELDIKMTYMDVRFLIEDLGLEIQEKRSAPSAAKDAAAVGSAPAGQDDLAEEPELMGGSVAVEMDRIAKPGSVVSGGVTFSDGKKAQWYLDQMGRLGLDPQDPAYRPSQEDIQAFQTELQALMQRQGF